MTTEDRPILEVAGLRKDFKRIKALGGIDITLDGPGVYGFLGPNGAGKTTTFKLICGLLRPTEGIIRIDGDDVGSRSFRVLSKLGVQFDGRHVRIVFLAFALRGCRQFGVEGGLATDDHGFLADEQPRGGLFAAGCARRPVEVGACVRDATGVVGKALHYCGE